MPSASRMSTPIAVDLDEIQGRYAPLGDLHGGVRDLQAGRRPGPVVRRAARRSLPVRALGRRDEGQLTFRWVDHEETYVAGDAYYAPPGHLPLVTGGTSIVEFSPSEELDRTMAVIQGNLDAGGGAAMTTTSGGHQGGGCSAHRVPRDREPPEGLFAPDVFLDLSLPQWRVQVNTADEVVAVRAERPSLPRTGSRRAAQPDRHRVRHRVRGALGPPGPELVLPGDDPRRRGGRHHRRDGGVLHRGLGRGHAARARRRRPAAATLTVNLPSAR